MAAYTVAKYHHHFGEQCFTVVDTKAKPSLTLAGVSITLFWAMVRKIWKSGQLYSQTPLYGYTLNTDS